MIEITLNGRSLGAASLEQLGVELNLINAVPQFELWVSVTGGPSMCMLRNGQNAWLMYLRESGDSGFRSCGELDRLGVGNFVLSSGQVDEYPLSWCIGVEQCYQAIAYFYVNDGAKPECITWHEE
ncbi:hypothetical protein [Variovorax gossypii]